MTNPFQLDRPFARGAVAEESNGVRSIVDRLFGTSRATPA